MCHVIVHDVLRSSDFLIFTYFLFLSHKYQFNFSRKNDAYDDKGPDEVVGERVRRVGGQDQYDAELDPNTYL